MFRGERDDFQNISAVSHDACGRISSRIFIDEQGIPLKSLPVGGEEGVDEILDFVTHSKEGFALSLRSEEFSRGQEKDLIRITTPEHITSFRPRLNDEKSRLVLFKHSFAVLTKLSEMQRVATDIGTSNWPYHPSYEAIWELLNEIEDSTRQMILERNPLVKMHSAIRTTHFFDFSSRLASFLIQPKEEI